MSGRNALATRGPRLADAKDAAIPHVKKVGSADNSWYLLPLCDSCNKLKDPFEKKESISVASAAK